jgi:hypothetical protein
MKSLVCAVFVSLFLVAGGVQADEHCLSGTCKRPVKSVVDTVVSPVAKAVVATPVKLVHRAKRCFRLSRCR